MSSFNFPSCLVPPVAELSLPTTIDSSSRTLRTTAPPRLSERQLAAIRLARAALSKPSKDVTYRMRADVVDALFEATELAYSSVERPVLSNIAASLLDVLIERMGSNSCGRGFDPLPHLCLRASGPVDVLQCLHTLQSALSTSEGFCLPQIGLGISRAVRGALGNSGDDEIEVSESALASAIVVAAGVLNPHGIGNVAPGLGPTGRPTRLEMRRDGVILSYSFVPGFSSYLSFANDRISISLQRNGLRTLIALFVSDHPFPSGIFQRISLIAPTPAKQGMLRIAGLVSLPLTVRRFLAIQRLCATVWANPDFQAWSSYRALLYGDI